LEGEPGLGLRIVALLDLGEGVPPPVPDSVYTVHRLVPDGLFDWLEAHGRPHVVVVAEPEQNGHGDWLERLSLYESGIQVVPALSGLPLLGVGASIIFRHDVLLLRIRNHLERGPGAWLKRSFDILGAAAGLVALSPLFLWVAVLIRRQGGEGAVFFGHERIGCGGRPFRCWKFRTMVSDSQKVLDHLLRTDPEALSEWERDFKLRNDPRITRVGAFLRRTSLDELPQLWNVLRGEMSLVGPRPVVAPEIERYGARAEFYRSVRPGLTGLWQVSGRSDLSYPERVALDAWYVKNWRFWYDIAILAKTVRAVLRFNESR
jgi:undecaprenyl-phosphate galactose phosphotransferase